MTAEIKLTVGGDLADDVAAFVEAWHRAGRGERVDEHVLAFESWEGLARVMTAQRYQLLRHLHRSSEASVSALARALGRQYRRVHDDVVALESAGLLTRADGGVRIVADTITAEVRLAA